MSFRSSFPAVLGLVLFSTALPAQVTVAGRILDDTGAAIAGARVELRPTAGGTPVVASSDAAGKYALTLPAPGEYAIRAERLGFYLYQNRSQAITAPTLDLTITLNHLQEFSDRIDVAYSAPAIDPKEPSDKK